MTDTRIRGGTIQTPAGPLRADVVVRGELVAALIEPDEPSEAIREISS